MKNKLSLVVFVSSCLALAFAPGRALAARAVGVDVSHYQGSFSWTTVHNSGVVFAWCKATEDTGYTDPTYGANISGAKGVGIPISGYHFAHPESDSPGAQVAHYWAVAGNDINADGLTLSPMLDMEVFNGVVNASSYSDWVNQYNNGIVANAAAKGVHTTPAVYFSACADTHFNTSISGWISDIANYNGQNNQTGTPWSACSSGNPWGGTTWHVWQYTDAAIEGDGDVYNGPQAQMSAAMVATSTGYPNYGFNSDAQGWTVGNGLTGFTWTACCGWPGIIYADQNANDGFFYSPATGFNASANPSVNVNVYVQNTAAPHDMQLFWKTTADNTWTSGKSTPIVNYTDANVWFRVNLDANNAAWTGKVVNQLRLDVDNTSHGNRFLIDHVVAQTTPRYTFDANTQGWVSGNSLSPVSWSGTGWPGIIYADQTGNDCFYLGPAMNFWGANNDRVHVRVYPQSGTSGGVHDAQLFWTTSVDGAFSEAKSSGMITYYGNDQFIDIYFNVGLNTYWNGNNNGGGNGGSITQLRLDFDQTNHGTRWIVDSVQIEHVNYDLPSITTQPTSQSTTVGGTATFSVVGNGGNSPLSYQWWIIGSTGATPISGQTSSSLVINNAQLTDATNYLVTVYNQASAINSAVVSLTVTGNTPPTITTQPSSLTVNQGQNAAFSVVATGSPAPTYQWTFNGGNISGATASAYTVVSAQPANAGNYAVVVANVAGSVTSANAALTVNVPPSITTQPASQTVNQGQNATFSVVATGTAPLTYQWRINTLSISGATASSYTRVNCQPADAGSYSVVVANVAGSITSADAILTVNTPPTITTQPASLLASVSNSVTFSVSASGTAPLTYQWSKNGGAISGATLSSLSLTALTWASAGSYSVVINNSVGSTTSANAILTMQQAAFTFVDGLESYAVGALDNNYAGGPNNNQANPWWGIPTLPELAIYTNRNGIAPHSGSKMVSTTATQSFAQNYLNLPYRMNAGKYYFGNIMLDWWFYDPKGTGTGASNYYDYMAIAEYLPVSLTNDQVTTTFTNFTQRLSLGAVNIAGANLGVYQSRIPAAVGGFNVNGWFNTTTARSIGWHHGRILVGIPVANSGPVSMYIDNMTNATFSFANSVTNVGFNLLEINAGFGGVGNAGNFDDFSFRVDNDPWIAQQPINTTVTTGQNTSFCTVAVGTAYQWQFNGSNISGATATTYSIVNAQAGNAGNYNCVVTGANGTTNTAVVTLTVQ